MLCVSRVYEQHIWYKWGVCTTHIVKWGVCSTRCMSGKEERGQGGGSRKGREKGGGGYLALQQPSFE